MEFKIPEILASDQISLACGLSVVCKQLDVAKPW